MRRKRGLTERAQGRRAAFQDDDQHAPMAGTLGATFVRRVWAHAAPTSE
jgi:hypothetical protein